MAGDVALADPLARLGARLRPLPGIGIILHLQRGFAVLIANEVTNDPWAGIKDKGVAGAGVTTNSVIQPIGRVVINRSVVKIDSESTLGLIRERIDIVAEALAGQSAKQGACRPGHEFWIRGGHGKGRRRGGAAPTNLKAQLIRAIHAADAAGGLGPNYICVRAGQNGKARIIIPHFVDAILISQKQEIFACECINYGIKFLRCHRWIKILKV